MIDPKLKRALGQAAKGVEVVAATHDGVTRAYTSHWVCQVSFEEPVVMASVSPKHDTHPLIAASGRFSVSILGGDQVEAGQYFSYPGHRMGYVADEYLRTEHGLPVVVDCVAWLACAMPGMAAAQSGPLVPSPAAAPTCRRSGSSASGCPGSTGRQRDTRPPTDGGVVRGRTYGIEFDVCRAGHQPQEIAWRRSR